MEFLGIEAALDVTTKTFIKDLENYERHIQMSIGMFLRDTGKNCLVLETSETKPVSVIVLQTLKKLQLEKHYKKNRCILTYLESDNQTFVEWQQLIKIMGQEKELPIFKNLIICAVMQKLHLTEQEGFFKKVNQC